MIVASTIGTRPAGLLLAGSGLVLTAFVWGAAIPFTSTLLRSFDATLLPALRFLIAAPVLVLLTVGLEKRWPFAAPLPWFRVLLLGGSMAAFATCYTIGISRSDPVTAAILFTGGPIIAALMAKVMYRTPFEPGLGVAVLLAVGGGVLLVFGVERGSAGGLGLRGGEILIVFAMVCWSWYSLKAQEWLARRGVSQLKLSTVTCTACGLVLLAIYAGVSLGGWRVVPPQAPDVGDFAMLLWISVLGAGFAVFMWNYGNSRVGVPVASLYGNLAPVFAVLVASLFGAPMTLLQILGGVLVLLGVVQVQVRRVLAERQIATLPPET